VAAASARPLRSSWTTIWYRGSIDHVRHGHKCRGDCRVERGQKRVWLPSARRRRTETERSRVWRLTDGYQTSPAGGDAERQQRPRVV
jgi:hypothetical protein